ncbi:hypothetical protein H7F15_10280 [Pontibacter sp. Tf4]|uniref:hypothetical protein n=1 Tax=Pontibacter sp. Tf4 TaxID=2761620 RepID=UPI00162562BB|nr:hypothetical protein [Pontibacter sp. Tf4]MBB6611422.1 hypothetical protein [Pontibacter sp. Tf4]
MSSADKKEYGELEQSMWRRFQEAEAMPDPEVWARIDHALTMQENAKYKKRVLFYRQLAAACFVLFVLAGSALLLHYKQDQEEDLLATTTVQPQPATPDAENTTVADNATIASVSGNTAATQSSGREQQTSAGDSPTTGTNALPTIAQARPADVTTTVDQPASASYLPQTQRSRQRKETVAASGRTGMIAAAGTNSRKETIALSATENTAAAMQDVPYISASQAIANVPESYTSPSALNPLLRRNAALGTYSSGSPASATIAPQKQADLSLALNTPAENNSKQERNATGNSRWNVGMGVTSSYFSQDVNIPEQRLMAMQGMGVLRHTGPVVSAETEQNLIAAYKEFEENTQPASSFAVEAKTGFRVGKRFKLLTGLGFSQNKSRTKTSYIVEQFLFNPRSNERTKLQPSTVFLPSIHTFTTDSVSVVKTKEPFDVDYSYQMLSVPLGVQVEGSIGQKWFWYATGSAAVNFLMQTTIKAHNPEIASVTYSATDDSPFRKVQFSGNAGAGVGKHLSDAVSISVGPEFRSYFNSMLSDEHATGNHERPYTIGLNVGVNYRLGH